MIKKALLSAIAIMAMSASLMAQNNRPRTTSILNIYDTTTGQVTVVGEYNYHLEAPNWTQDGKWLIFNSGGHLYKVSPDGKTEPQMIDSGYASNCNNDHVLSPAGNEIAISHFTKEDHQSRVYIIPIEGGEPRLITPVGPSYLHGWSPDGSTFAYHALRSNNTIKDIYIMPSKGGEEKRLTTAEGVDDGPEYSPDGKHIWFNSERSGLMQVWRMNPDGSEQTQMTFMEDFNSWFPHVSPDGKQIVFIAYHKGDLEPGQHLANKNVEIMIMPYEGGTPKSIIKLFGGQGTINVNSWAPDSKRFAFVSYRLEQ